LLSDESISNLPGVVTADNIVPEGNPLAPKPLDLDVLPIPDLRLIRGFDSKKRVFRKVVVPVQASRGCPYDCAFCSVTGMFGRRFRFRSVDNVMEELLRNSQRRLQVFFYDDNLAANPTWFAELLERMASEKQTFKWSAQVRVEVARDRELLALMKRAGCTALFIGVESFNAATLKAMNKQQTPDEIAEAMVRFREHRLKVHGMFVLGMDTDTPESIRKTVRWAKQARFSSVQFLILTPLPGTRTFAKLADEGRILFDDWSLYDAHHVTFQPAQMSPAELQSLQLEAHDSFYSRMRTLGRAVTWRIEPAGIFIYARRLQREWRKANSIFQDLLKLMERSGGMIKSVRFIHPARRLSTANELSTASSWSSPH
jgi:radical SAM superfamily enzyme YgiQ (UPF0313 family)